MLEETKERTRLDILEKLIRNTEHPIDQIFDALNISAEKRESYLEILSTVISQRAQREASQC